MSTSSDLRDLFNASRPLVEQWLDLGEQFSAFREAAREKGIDWAQVKALLKAQIQDDRDGTGENTRVNKLLEKADCATAYADMLKLGTKEPAKNISREVVEPEASRAPRETVAEPVPAIEPTELACSSAVERLAVNEDVAGSMPAEPASDPIPPFLARDKDNRVPDIRP